MSSYGNRNSRGMSQLICQEMVLQFLPIIHLWVCQCILMVIQCLQAQDLHTADTSWNHWPREIPREIFGNPKVSQAIPFNLQLDSCDLEMTSFHENFKEHSYFLHTSMILLDVNWFLVLFKTTSTKDLNINQFSMRSPPKAANSTATKRSGSWISQ